ncbi:MAG: M48 family metallopeptidase, partial [Desulfomonilia bacterium]
MFWSIIAANKRKTIILAVSMGVFLVLMGYLIGMAFVDVYHPMAGLAGLGVALIVWTVMLMVSFWGSDRLFLGMSNAREVGKESYPQLYNVVEEMKIASSLPKMPKIYVVDDPAPNAFAVGKSPHNSAICVTAGLLATCNRDELQGVVAHEIGHILNRDILYMTVAATMLGSILIITDVFLRSMRYSSTMRFGSRSRNRSGGRLGAVILLATLVLAILGPILARILYFSISRRREYLADATSARLTRYPEGLASALEKISTAPGKLSSAPSAIAPFYTVNPYKQHLSSSPFATHPPLEERIRILRAMSMGAGYLDYMKAYVDVTGRREALVRHSDLPDTPGVEIRQPLSETSSAETSPAQARKKTGDMLRALNNFAFIPCLCGMRIKVPPEYDADSITCPRCGRNHTIPATDAQALGAVLATSAAFSSTHPSPRVNLGEGT